MFLVKAGYATPKGDSTQRYSNLLVIDNFPFLDIEWRLRWGVFSNADEFLCLIIFPCTSLHFKLVPVLYQEYENGLFSLYAGGP